MKQHDWKKSPVAIGVGILILGILALAVGTLAWIGWVVIELAFKALLLGLGIILVIAAIVWIHRLLKKR